VKYDIVYSSLAQKDAKRLQKSNLKNQAEKIIAILSVDPFQPSPRYEALIGNLHGCYSRRINIHHRLVYEVFEEEKIVHVLRMWSHYE
jgi:Txe/YoeB family toxin of toxin-antitoxin system